MSKLSLCCWAAVFGDRQHPYQMPTLARYEIVRETPNTVRLRRPDGTEFSASRHQAYWLPTQSDWVGLVADSDRYQTALDRLADGLRRLGRYDRMLAQAGSSAPNPLAPSVIEAPDPDKDWDWADDGVHRWDLPRLERLEPERHTPKMLHTQKGGKRWSTGVQHNFFLCPGDDEWNEVSTLHSDCAAAKDALLNRLKAIGICTDKAPHHAEPWTLDEQDVATDPPLVVGDEVEVLELTPDLTPLALGRSGTIMQINGKEVVVEILSLDRMVRMQLHQVRRRVPLPPPRPQFTEGDRVRGRLAKAPHLSVEGTVDTQNDAVVFISNDEHTMVAIQYEGLELLEAASPDSSSSPADPWADFLGPLGEFEESTPVAVEVVAPLDSLDRLALEINAQHSRCEAALGEALHAARAAGELLQEARSEIRASKGRNWLRWLDENFKGSHRTAYNYIAIAEGWEELIEPNLQRDANSPLGIRQALALLSQRHDEEEEAATAESDATAEPSGQHDDTSRPATTAPPNDDASDDDKESPSRPPLRDSVAALAASAPQYPPGTRLREVSSGNIYYLVAVSAQEATLNRTADGVVTSLLLDWQEIASQFVVLPADVDPEPPAPPIDTLLHDAEVEIPVEYVITRSDGSPIAGGAQWLILRLDADPVARAVAADYVARIEDSNPALAESIRARLHACTPASPTAATIEAIDREYADAVASRPAAGNPFSVSPEAPTCDRCRHQQVYSVLEGKAFNCALNHIHGVMTGGVIAQSMPETCGAFERIGSGPVFKAGDLVRRCDCPPDEPPLTVVGLERSRVRVQHPQGSTWLESPAKLVHATL